MSPYFFLSFLFVTITVVCSINLRGLCSSHDFECEPGICYNKKYRCDGGYDCINRRDEEGCGPCTPNEFECEANWCIEKIHRCDGINDCDNGRDEEGCVPACQPFELRCHNNVTCVDERKFCDGKADCPDGSDEIHCRNRFITTIGGKQYYIEDFLQATWELAFLSCRKYGLHLVSMENPLAKKNIKEYLLKNDLKEKAFWTSATDSHLNSWYWLDIGYSLKDKIENNSTDEENHCLAIKGDIFYKTNCDETNYFICEYRLDQPLNN